MPRFSERAVCLPSTEVPTHEYLLEGQGEAGRTGILLVHGLTGTPNEMRVLARGLNNQGYTVLAVQLAGHCGTLQDLVGTSWLDWLCSVRRGADVLARRVDRVFVGGLSMGAVLALALAQERPKQIAGVLALSPVFRHDGWSMPCYTKLSFLLPVFRWLGIGRHSVFFERAPYGIKDEALRSRVVAKMRAGDSVASGLPGNPWWSVIEMRKLSASVLRRMEALSVPCLVVHAKNDDIASVSNAFDIVSRARFAEVHLHLLNNSYHMITIDRERRQVIDRAVAFVAAVVGRNQHTGLDHVR
ncbi:carboxylesterase [Bordetella sp. N]|uniref:alpha/beta hydrolase n=1 Tax=Bordetella sp. N TaxID=1746199 RepID=UPI00070BBE6D|nr:alpha/beta fold hydrolase [Bordetella sp. N]ALM85199.1 alpha/beta hydrolase [Bordetella sp. N]